MRHILDIECYKDYFLVMTLPLDGGPPTVWELVPRALKLPLVLPGGTYITFNGLHYDFPLLSAAICGADNLRLKVISDDIIKFNMKPWDIESKYGIPKLTLDHIDLMHVATGQVSLKGYGGRLHSNKLQDLPIDPNASITSEQRGLLKAYCHNDLLITRDLYYKLLPQIELRERLGREYEIDLRSKSDAQIAEAVIRRKMEKCLGRNIYRPDIHPSYKFQYKPPVFIKFQSPGMRRLMRVVSGAEISLDADGSVKLPREMESLRLRIGKGLYRMGIGGLHSTESCVSHMGGLIDRDVTSYYPSIILTQGLYPSHLGPKFLEVYRDIYDTRLAAKAAGNMIVADCLKIVLNGSFGKFGSKWSVLYSPELMIQVTIGGQLALLMLIEMLEECGIEVISANTDGVVINGQRWAADQIIAHWEQITGFKTEETIYKALYQKDVNNYIAIKSDGKVKLKGLYATGGLSKNPTNSICVEAVISKLTGGDDIPYSIKSCSDIRKFCTVRQVKGGARCGPAYLGKAVRWYYAVGEEGYIEYATNGNKVARSDGARPIMELPETIPYDLDYDWYIREANGILEDIGCIV